MPAGGGDPIETLGPDVAKACVTLAGVGVILLVLIGVGIGWLVS